MKKDRDSFFSGYGYGTAPQGMSPGLGMPMQGGMQGMPMQGGPHHVAANSNFYAGPGMEHQHMMPTDIDSRLSKMERKINRLEMRVNKLEGDTTSMPFTENDYNYSNSMYMV